MQELIVSYNKATGKIETNSELVERIWVTAGLDPIPKDGDVNNRSIDNYDLLFNCEILMKDGTRDSIAFNASKSTVDPFLKLTSQAEKIIRYHEFRHSITKTGPTVGSKEWEEDVYKTMGSIRDKYSQTEEHSDKKLKCNQEG